MQVLVRVVVCEIVLVHLLVIAEDVRVLLFLVLVDVAPSPVRVALVHLQGKAAAVGCWGRA